ncbi:hypothetical protein [Aquitalea denitrificans]|uniref:hypothetical protein n=1 Tax=Aquitalea denitrificans TaxID=519081 RepID=UPI0013599D6F|nr:hypothetical protein [Aquitalea denitrificans]
MTGWLLILGAPVLAGGLLMLLCGVAILFFGSLSLLARGLAWLCAVAISLCDYWSARRNPPR